MGPSSMLFGRGSTGGVINQVMKKPSLAKAIELSSSVTSNGLTRFTADANLPFDTDAAARVNAMFQRGKTSTRDLTEALDFGLAPSVKLGIGTPTEITLSALLQHNHDQVDYGVPPYNGFPLNAPRNTAWLQADGTTTGLGSVPPAAKNTTAGVIRTFSGSGPSAWSTVTSFIDGTNFLVMTFRISAVTASQYVRLRGTNMPPAVPFETDAASHPTRNVSSGTRSNNRSLMASSPLTPASFWPTNTRDLPSGIHRVRPRKTVVSRTTGT